MSDDIDALTSQGMEALRTGNHAAASEAFTKRDSIAREIYGGSAAVAPAPAAPDPNDVLAGMTAPAPEPVVENLAGMHADTQLDSQDIGDMLAVFAQSVSGQHLGPADINRAGAAAAEWGAANPRWDAEWTA